jgi:hypothetical protein
MTNQANLQQRGLKSADLQCSHCAVLNQWIAQRSENLREVTGKIRPSHLDNESNQNPFRRLALPTSFGLSHVFLTAPYSAQDASDAITFSDGMDPIYFT